MLGGIDPIIIFQFAKLAPSFGETVSKIPVLSKVPTLIEMPPIPVYLSENITGLFIDTESKSVDLETDTETMTDGSAPEVTQKGIQSGIEVNIMARKDSLGLTLISALIDQVFDKATSKEYAITYLHGPVTIFRGLLHSYAVEQSAENELLRIRINLSKGSKTPAKPSEIPVVGKVTGGLPL